MTVRVGEIWWADWLRGAEGITVRLKLGGMLLLAKWGACKKNLIKILKL